ncbi:hypothetical protein QRQ56_10650 [Bradyrhizobium sp. U531]
MNNLSIAALAPPRIIAHHDGGIRRPAIELAARAVARLADKLDKYRRFLESTRASRGDRRPDRPSIQRPVQPSDFSCTGALAPRRRARFPLRKPTGPEFAMSLQAKQRR